nr:spore coat U domain-containing protein [uncultured Lichenicoccus sp.]
MPVSITLLAGCSINATSVAFPALSRLSAARTATGILRTTCTDTTPFNIGLDQGSGAGASTTVRLMSGPPSAFIAYGLFQNSALSANFGNTVGSDTVPGTGLDTSQAITVYAEVPSQAAPKPGAYADVVNVVVTF